VPRSSAWCRPTLALVVVALAATGCAQQVAGTAAPAGGGPSAVAPAGPAAGPAAGSAAPGALAPGPVTVITLGDSLTAGAGDDRGQGFAGLVADAVAARPERAGSTLVNLGQSGWTSTEMIDGQSGAPGQLGQALDAIRAAAPAPVLATVLIGSNDLWFVYQNGTANPTPSTEEDAAVATYRGNVDRTVRELQAAGAVVVVGLPDDQSLRPIATDIARVNEQLSDVTEEEIGAMSALSKVFARTASEVAAAHGVRTVDTNDPFWADPARMADDGIHPNTAGYAVLGTRWLEVIDPLL
jgi:lysophospholipase L1-like esterase